MKLDQFLKFKNLAATGGQAKYFIQSGEVSVNGELETRRGRQLIVGDVVTFQGQSFEVEAASH
ncbi:MAG: RNA-binding S4 domain-containing protein [Thermosynechococcaceae cyanobacterium]